MRIMARIAAIHATHPLDLVLVSGDMTDAGRATEWAEFLDTVGQHPSLAARMIVLPGNHDVNIVDRANPALLDLPFSTGKRLRQIRALSAIAAVQGDRVRVIARQSGRFAETLNEALALHRLRIVTFAKIGGLRRSLGLGGVFDDQFPMILPPETEDGLGVAILNSNAQTHFSFTNALGLVSVEQVHALNQRDRDDERCLRELVRVADEQPRMVLHRRRHEIKIHSDTWQRARHHYSLPPLFRGNQARCAVTAMIVKTFHTTTAANAMFMRASALVLPVFQAQIPSPSAAVFIKIKPMSGEGPIFMANATSGLPSFTPWSRSLGA